MVARLATRGRKANDDRAESEDTMTAALTLRQLRNDLVGPFDLELGAGTCAAISGPSGSGKSLFLRMIADLDPNEGEVWLGGAERASFGPTQWRGRVTYVSAESGW